MDSRESWIFLESFCRKIEICQDQLRPSISDSAKLQCSNSGLAGSVRLSACEKTLGPTQTVDNPGFRLRIDFFSPDKHVSVPWYVPILIWYQGPNT